MSVSYVIKRNGTKQKLSFDKVLKRIEALSYDLSPVVNVAEIAKITVSRIVDGILTSELDTFAASECAMNAIIHPDYSVLAARIEIDSLQKETPKTFSNAVDILSTGPLLQPEFIEFVKANREVLDDAINHKLDFNFDYFGISTLIKAYLLRHNGKIVERPQYMYMRVAIGLNLYKNSSHHEDADIFSTCFIRNSDYLGQSRGDVLRSILETYNAISTGMYTHATPTLYNAGTINCGLASCFLMTFDDSLTSVADAWKEVALISKNAGGIGMSVSQMRASGSYIRGNGGASSGLVPMLRVFNNIARYIGQNGGKRKGTISPYVECWHKDIKEFLMLKNNSGDPELRTRDLFTATWISDLFMERVECNESWSLFCPDEAKGLNDCYGDEFKKLYLKYENDPTISRTTVSASEIFALIIEQRIETGNPYILFKDACNRKSNQKNLGTIRSSNLCTEIIEYCSPEETAVCTLASIALPKCIGTASGEKFFDFSILEHSVEIATKNLDKAIDATQYPSKKCRLSNMRHRPIGLGVQGLANVFATLEMSFGDKQSLQLNYDIFKCIYYTALKTSIELAKVYGKYSTFDGSPMSEGLLQQDLWEIEGKLDVTEYETNTQYACNFDAIRADLVKYGARNSLLVAPMPTATTAQILGNSECINPYDSNLFTRNTRAGTFVVPNKELVRDIGPNWDSTFITALIRSRGSLMDVDDDRVNMTLRQRYRTAYEIPTKDLIHMAAIRSVWIDQSQSLSFFKNDPSIREVALAIRLCWRKGMKTGGYYLFSNEGKSAVNVDIDVQLTSGTTVHGQLCTRENLNCDACSA